MRRPRNGTVLATVLVVALMVFVLPVGASTAAPSPSSAAAVPWAYGHVRSVSVGPLRAGGGWVYEASATLGFAVILNQSNASETQFELSSHRAMGVRLSVEYCLTSCPNPSAYATLAFSAWETVDSYANLTTAGSVRVGDVSVPALALVNASSYLVGNLSETVHRTIPTLGPTAPTDRYLSATLSSALSVDFTTPLGLFPLDLPLATSENWTNSSAFAAHGTIDSQYLYHSASQVGNFTLGPVTNATSLSPTGTVTLNGSYTAGSPGDSVSFGGVTYPAFELSLSGPFVARDGFVLVPSTADLFGPGPQPWGGNASGESTASMALLDARASSDGHVGIVASNWVYDTSSVNVAELSTSTAGLSPLVAPGVSTPMYPGPSAAVQGTPESVYQATSDQSCLVGGTGCPVAQSPTGNALRSLLRSTLVPGIVATVIVVALVAVAQRRRMPPPAFPNATLYPPGAAPAPSTRPSAPAPPAEPEEDPLGHLW